MRWIAAFLLLSPLSLSAAELHIYNGYGWVRETRDFKLERGLHTLALENLPRAVEPGSVLLLPQEESSFTVRGQHYRFDLLSQDALLGRYLGQEITVERLAGESVLRDKGTLLSVSPVTLKKTDGSLLSFTQVDGLSFPSVPAGLATSPSLFVQAESTRGGPASADLLYQTGGLRWWLDYSLKLTAKDRATLSGDLSVENTSGKAFDDVSLSVIEGTIPEAAQGGQPMPKAYTMRAMAMDAAAPEMGTQAMNAGDVKRYKLKHSATLPDNSTTRVPFFEAPKSLKLQKIYRYETTQFYGGGIYTDPAFGLTPREEVSVALRFKNEGDALPAGRVRVFETNRDGVVFLGQPALQRASKGEEITLPLGTAFDLTAKRTQEAFEQDSKRNQMEEALRIELTNRSDEDVTVEVAEHLYRAQNAEVLEKSHPFSRQDANTLLFSLKIPAGKTETLRYKVRYRW